MTNESPRVHPLLAAGLAVILCGALIIFGFGMTALALDRDPISVTGLGPLPGVTGVLAVLVTVGIITAAATARPHPSYLVALPTLPAALVAYVAGFWIGVLVAGANVARAGAGLGQVVTSWFVVVLVLAAAISVWSAVALVRTQMSPPRWPWEEEDE